MKKIYQLVALVLLVCSACSVTRKNKTKSTTRYDSSAVATASVSKQAAAGTGTLQELQGRKKNTNLVLSTQERLVVRVPARYNLPTGALLLPHNTPIVVDSAGILEYIYTRNTNSSSQEQEQDSSQRTATNSWQGSSSDSSAASNVQVAARQEAENDSVKRTKFLQGLGIGIGIVVLLVLIGGVVRVISKTNKT